MDAGNDVGRTQAQILLPDWPSRCKQHVAYATGRVGMDPVALDKLDRGQIDYANTHVIDWCADHYAQLQKLIAQATASN